MSAASSPSDARNQMRPTVSGSSQDHRAETGGRIVNNDAQFVAATPLAVCYETLVRVSQAIGAHGELKELFGVLANELQRAVQFDLIGVSLRDENSDAFQNYFIDMANGSELVPDEELTPEETLTLRVYDRQEPLLRDRKS